VTDDSDAGGSRDPRARASAELVEIGTGELGVEGRVADLDPDATRIDDREVSDLAVFARQAWERHSGTDEPDFRDTEWASDRIERYETKTAHRAVRDGDLSTMDHMIGKPSYSNDASGLHTVREFEEFLTGGAQTRPIYLAATMGSGKTDFALSALEVIEYHYRRARETAKEIDGLDPSNVPKPEFGANFSVTATVDGVEVEHVDNFDHMVADDGGDGWIPRDASSDDVRWFIFDEASTELTAQSGANAQDVAEVMAPFIKKMRKLGVNMIIIGHDRGDVHPAIRSIAQFIDKRGLKRASVYRGIKSRQPVGHMFDLDGIPPTTWEFSTDDLAEWTWGSAVDGDGDLDSAGMSTKEIKERLAVRAARLYQESDMSQKQAAAAMSGPEISISVTMLRNALDGKYGDLSE
jgi:hypothetical protein